MLEYSDNYADTTGSLYQYKGLESRDNNANVGNLGTALSSFKYQSGLVQKQLTTPNSEMFQPIQILILLIYTEFVFF